MRGAASFRASVRRAAGMPPLWAMRGFGRSAGGAVTVIHAAPVDGRKKGDVAGLEVAALPVRARRTDQEPSRPRKTAGETAPVSACTPEGGEASAPAAGGADAERADLAVARSGRAGGDLGSPARAAPIGVPSIKLPPIDRSSPQTICLPRKAPVVDWAKVAEARRGTVTRSAARKPKTFEDEALPERPVRAAPDPLPAPMRAMASYAGTRWCAQCDMRVTAHEANGCSSVFCKAPRA